ncbi:MAG: glutamate 5-kinase [Clostridia bacterium]|nr:glutamate 5-kinase [Clostridia bacterium]
MDAKKKRIVVKVGTSTLTYEDGNLNFRRIDRLAMAISSLMNMGNELVLVSSGAIAVGVSKLRLPEKPKELRMKQAAASVGQCELIHIYDKFFGEYGKTVGQILLNGEDVDDPKKRLNLTNTFESLLEKGILPIVNENDSVNCAEIESDKKIFGDNDGLSALVAVMCGADLLILLSDIDGLYDGDPRTNPEARFISRVDDVSTVVGLAGGAGSRRGTGGMITKLEAAKTATDNGIDMIITNGSRPENLFDIAEHRVVGTLFKAKKEASVCTIP